MWGDAVSWYEIPYCDQVPVVPGGAASWCQAAEAGIDLSALWLLRATAVASTPIEPVPMTRLIVTDADGTELHSQHPRTPEEQAELDGDVNEFLAELGLPPRPGNRSWWLQIPAGLDPEQVRRYWWSHVYATASPDDGPRGEFVALEALFRSPAGPWP